MNGWICKMNGRKTITELVSKNCVLNGEEVNGWVGRQVDKNIQGPHREPTWVFKAHMGRSQWVLKAHIGRPQWVFKAHIGIPQWVHSGSLGLFFGLDLLREWKFWRCHSGPPGWNPSADNQCHRPLPDRTRARAARFCTFDHSERVHPERERKPIVFFRLSLFPGHTESGQHTQDSKN